MTLVLSSHDASVSTKIRDNCRNLKGNPRVANASLRAVVWYILNETVRTPLMKCLVLGVACFSAFTMRKENGMHFNDGKINY